MYKKLWKNLYSAVCSINFYSDNGIKLNSLSGFKVNNHIITDEFIYKIQKCDEVTFHFVNEDGCTTCNIVKMSFEEFIGRINRIAEYESEGYALIDFDGINTDGHPSMSIELDTAFNIGQEIAIIGYHTDQDNLSFKKGIISSFFKAKNDKRFIQFDAFIKQGNYGSPLINVNTGKVIGVVGYQLSPITQTYETFKSIIDENLRLLKKSEGKMNILDIDPIQVLIANQNQLKQISKEFYKSATMSFGYAHQIHTIQKYITDTNIAVEVVSKKKK